MGKRFFFINEYSHTKGEAWRGPFNSTPIPRIDEEVTITCTDKISRTGKVIKVSYMFSMLEVWIFLKLEQ
jgi:hypothetical protein